jgi:hypothetical protein
MPSWLVVTDGVGKALDPGWSPARKINKSTQSDYYTKQVTKPDCHSLQLIEA